MINRIGVSSKDGKTLEKLLKYRREKEDTQPENYKNKVVIKPWGYEFLIFENEHFRFGTDSFCGAGT